MPASAARASNPDNRDDSIATARAHMVLAGNLPIDGAIRHGYFSRRGGVSSGLYGTLNCGPGSADAPDAVRENRDRVVRALGATDTELVTVYQEHGVNVTTVRPDAVPDGSVRADGLVTDAPGFALGILTADCAPVLFADPEARVIGACHAGWRGAFGGVAEATVAAMQSLGARPARILAAIGPCIGPESYEVGPEFPKRFLERDPGDAEFFRPAPRQRRHLFDLAGYLTRRLRQIDLAGVRAVGRDTLAEDDMFFSYRRSRRRAEPDHGRMLSIICLEKPGIG